MCAGNTLPGETYITVTPDFQPGKWTKICSLHFEPSDFYNYWSNYRSLREDAVPSIFSFKVKPVSRKTRVALDLHHHVPNHEATDNSSLTSEGASGSLYHSNAADSTTQQLLQSDNGDDHDAQDDICTCICRQEVQRLEKEVIETSEEIRKLKQQLKEAHDDIARLRQQVKDVSTESSRYQKLAEERKFCFSNIEGSDKDMQFYTGLPSASIFYEVLDYVSPGRKRSNIVYRATAQQWANDQERGSEPGQATWRNYEGRPANLMNCF